MLYDMYVRFFRWATDRLHHDDGIVCFVSNNGFLDGVAFDGFRKSIAQEFTRIYHLNLKGNARTTEERRRREGGNVFTDQIRTGIGITLLIRSKKHEGTRIYYRAVEDYLKAEQKLRYLDTSEPYSKLEWIEIVPDHRGLWLTEGMKGEFDLFPPLGTRDSKLATKGAIPTLFRTYSLGVNTSRDSLVYSFDREQLRHQARIFVDIYNTTVDKLLRLGNKTDPSTLIDTVDSRIKWSRQTKLTLQRLEYSHYSDDYVTRALYRPYTRKNLYFDDFWNEERYKQHLLFPLPHAENENISIVISDRGHRSPFGVLATNSIIDFHYRTEKSNL